MEQIKATRLDRIKIVNSLIDEIASRGRRFFHYQGQTASIIVKNNRLYYVREWAAEGDKKELCLSAPDYYRLRKLHSGGTIKSLVIEFYNFIRSGRETDGNEGRGGLYSPHWGYPIEDMKAIRKKAFELGYINQLKES